jgi:hypothetical protein
MSGAAADRYAAFLDRLAANTHGRIAEYLRAGAQLVRGELGTPIPEYRR